MQPNAGTPSTAARTPAQEFKECVGLWDKGTHMTRGEWRATCRRIQNRLDDLTREAVAANKALGEKKKSTEK